MLLLRFPLLEEAACLAACAELSPTRQTGLMGRALRDIHCCLKYGKVMLTLFKR